MVKRPRPTDNSSHRFPVSVKGVIIRDDCVVLLKNERDEWELPGGKLEHDERPEECVEREVREELGLEVAARRIVDSWVYAITPDVRVFIVTYGCSEKHRRSPMLSPEHKDLAWVRLAQVKRLRMPAGYKRSIAAWSRLVASG